MPLQISLNDIATIGLLTFMEVILSIDNALVLAILARRLPKHEQNKALMYGLVASIVLRIGALAIAAYLMKWLWVKYVGGGYLVYVAVAHWMSKKEEDGFGGGKQRSFWTMVFLITLADLAFAIDSILAAVALSNKLWVVITGAIIGVVCMRFAAKSFMVLLDKFPNFEQTAYILVFGVGVKLIIDGLQLESINFHSSSSPAFWIFWIYVVAAIAYGLLPAKKHKQTVKDLKAVDEAVEEVEEEIEKEIASQTDKEIENKSK